MLWFPARRPRRLAFVLASLVLAAIVLALFALPPRTRCRGAIFSHFETSSSSCTVSANALWSSTRLRACRDRLPARSSIGGRQSSTSLRAGGGAHAGQPLAHHQADAVLERRVGAVADLAVFAAVKFVVEHGGEVRGDAVHAACADRFDARLFDRLEDRARLLAAGAARCTRRSWQARRSANESPWPRTTPPRLVSLRGGSGRRLCRRSAGRSAAKATSSSGSPAMARNSRRPRA